MAPRSVDQAVERRLVEERLDAACVPGATAGERDRLRLLERVLDVLATERANAERRRKRSRRTLSE
jgi:hypothetical protein